MSENRSDGGRHGGSDRGAPRSNSAAASPPAEPDDCLAMTWPAAAPGPAVPRLDSAYRLTPGFDQRAFVSVQTSIGFDVTDDHMAHLASTLVAPFMVFAVLKATNEATAVAAAERRAPGWVELSWVAVAPSHRGRGLGRAVCSAVTHDLVSAGERVVLSTQDERTAALAIYFEVGFQPVFRIDKVDRWRSACDHLGKEFAPDAWGWPAS